MRIGTKTVDRREWVIMQEPIRKLLTKRKNRAIAIILSTKEELCDEFLPESSSLALRKVVLDQLNEFYDMCLDVVGQDTGDELSVNEIWLERLEQIYDYVAKP